MAILGIDFGSSYTYVVKSNSNNPDKFYIIGEEKYSTNPNIMSNSNDLYIGVRTCICFDNQDNNWKIGKDVIDLSLNNENIKICDIKNAIRNIIRYSNRNYAIGHSGVDYYVKIDATSEEISIPEKDMFGLTVNGTFHNAIELGKLFFTILFEGYVGRDIRNERTLKDVSHIVIGMPSYSDYNTDPNVDNYRKYGLEPIIEYIKKYLKDNGNNYDISCDYVTEPVLVGVAALCSSFGSVVKNNEKILVIDIGNTTTDVAVIKKIDSNDEFDLVNCGKGNGVTAGEVYTQLIEGLLRDNGFYFNPYIAEAIKASLFKSKRQFCNELLVEPNSANGEELYNEYLTSGRYYQNSNLNYIIAYDKNMCNTNANTDGYKKIYCKEKFIGHYDDLKKFIEDYLKEIHVKNIDSVLYAGGTSNMDLLRNHMKEYCEGIIGKDCFFVEDNPANSINFANAVAVGAIHIGYKREKAQNNFIGVSVQDVAIKIEGVNNSEFLLLSQEIKNNGYKGSETSKISKLWIKRDHPEQQRWLNFEIRIGKIKTKKRISVENMDINSALLFFADVSTKGESVLFLLRGEKLTDKRQKHANGYQYTYINNQIYTGNLDKYVKTRHARKKDVIKYSITNRIDMESLRDKSLVDPSEDCKFHLIQTSYFDIDKNDGFGWIVN